ncbi:uncharacterized protein LOC121395364 [Xenopus laevis]|uniref:Uncharacterized protein LOC121395364 n=1 Tax=Xenopus laevis TaxID=8355 RepID=A0A8J1L528_XENLA|nr:uncharacterized protein LOC121395364 [Xenopus laevis]
MGSAVAPSFANLFVYKLEKAFFLREPYLVYIKHYYRYVDDILILWEGPANLFEEMVNEANRSHSTLKFTMESSQHEINFLDINIKIDENKIYTNLYRKTMDRNNLLHRKSFHNPKTLNAIPKGQYIRARKIASTETAFNQASKELTKRFVNRGYPAGHLSKVQQEVQKLTRQDLLSPKQQKTRDTDRLTFVSKYDKRSRSIENVIKRYWPILQHDPKYGPIFSIPPRFAYKRGKTIRDILCQNTAPKNEDKVFKGTPKIGTFPCLSCICCNSIIKGAHINHPATGKEIKLSTYATCSTNYVVYVLKCPCGKLYVGKTIRSVNTRIKEHKNAIRNFKANTYTDTSVSRHFSEARHNVCQLKWKVLEVVPKMSKGGDRNNLLLQRESRWINRLDSTYPKGMNEQLNLACFL